MSLEQLIVKRNRRSFLCHAIVQVLCIYLQVLFVLAQLGQH